MCWDNQPTKLWIMRSKKLYSVPRSACIAAIWHTHAQCSPLTAEQPPREPSSENSDSSSQSPPVPVSAATPDTHRRKASISLKHTRFGDTRTLVRNQGKRLSVIWRWRYAKESDVFPPATCLHHGLLLATSIVVRWNNGQVCRSSGSLCRRAVMLKYVLLRLIFWHRYDNGTLCNVFLLLWGGEDDCEKLHVKCREHTSAQTF